MLTLPAICSVLFGARRRIFKPSEHNPLVELLLARGVNGESLSRPNSPRRSRSRSASPSRKEQVARRRSHSAPPKKRARKLEGKRPAPLESEEEGGAYTEVQAEEPIAGVFVRASPRSFDYMPRCRTLQFRCTYKVNQGTYHKASTPEITSGTPYVPMMWLRSCPAQPPRYSQTRGRRRPR